MSEPCGSGTAPLSIAPDSTTRNAPTRKSVPTQILLDLAQRYRARQERLQAEVDAGDYGPLVLRLIEWRVRELQGVVSDIEAIAYGG